MTGLLSRIPRRLFGGRVHTGTVVLAVLFLVLLVVYGQRADHYARVDAESATPAPVTTSSPSPTEEYVPPTTVRTSTPSSSSAPSTPSSTSTETGASAPESTAPDGPGTTGGVTTTPAPGLPIPTIPGLRLPGQTPTTPPAR